MYAMEQLLSMKNVDLEIFCKTSWIPLQYFWSYFLNNTEKGV